MAVTPENLLRTASEFVKQADEKLTLPDSTAVNADLCLERAIAAIQLLQEAVEVLSATIKNEGLLIGRVQSLSDFLKEIPDARARKVLTNFVATITSKDANSTPWNREEVGTLTLAKDLEKIPDIAWRRMRGAREKDSTTRNFLRSYAAERGIQLKC